MCPSVRILHRKQLNRLRIVDLMYILYETFIYCISWLTVLSWVSCIYDLNLFAKASARNAQALQMHLKSGRHRLLSNKFLSHVNTFFNPLSLHMALSKEKKCHRAPSHPLPILCFFLKKITQPRFFLFLGDSSPTSTNLTVLYLSRSLSLPPPPPPSACHSTFLFILCSINCTIVCFVCVQCTCTLYMI